MAYKEITIPTYENKYKTNVQMQYGTDDKFTSNNNTYLTLALNYMQKLKTFANAWSEITSGTSELTDTQKKIIISGIGSLFGIEPFETYKLAYANISIADYIFLIKSKQAARQFDGTNKGLYELSKSVFGSDFNILIKDNGNMTVDIYFNGENISNTLIDLIEDGKVLPKVAGVGQLILYEAAVPSHWNLGVGDTPDTAGRTSGNNSGSWGQTLILGNREDN